MHDQYADSLSRRTWSLALIATAHAATVALHLAGIDACLEALAPDEFLAVASASSRVGISRTDRRLQEAVWNSSISLGPRTKLLLAHFTAGPVDLDPLRRLSEAELDALASPDHSAWPIARAITARMLSAPSPTLVEALTKLGPNSDIELPQRARPPADEYLSSVLSEPARYPGAWVVTAERWRSTATDEPAMEQFVLDEKWLPKVPRM
jgi:hypothetical protein